MVVASCRAHPCYELRSCPLPSKEKVIEEDFGPQRGLCDSTDTKQMQAQEGYIAAYVAIPQRAHSGTWGHRARESLGGRKKQRCPSVFWLNREKDKWDQETCPKSH